MLNRFLENREVIELFINSPEAKAINKNESLQNLSPIEWDQLNIITSILGLIDAHIKGKQLEFC